MIIPKSMGPISFAYDGKLSADIDAVVRALVSSTFLSLGKGVGKETRWSTLSAFNFLMKHGWDAVSRKAESQLREVVRVKARCLAVNLVLGHVLRTRPPLPESAVEHDALSSLEIPSDPLLRTALELGLLLAPEALDYAQVCSPQWKRRTKNSRSYIARGCRISVRAGGSDDATRGRLTHGDASSAL
jgi:hypothetical protein